MCEYLGLSAVKAELEDICFAVLEPLRFQKVHEDRSRLLAGELSSKSKVLPCFALCMLCIYCPESCGIVSTTNSALCMFAVATAMLIVFHRSYFTKKSV